MNNACKNVVVYLMHLLLTTALACTPAQQAEQSPAADSPGPTRTKAQPTRPCRQIIWQDANANRYHYRFDARQRLSQCTAFERTNSYGTYALTQQLTYTRQGLLQRVSDGEDSSQYHYRNGRLAFIDFFQAGQAVYRYQITTNERGLITELRGMPRNNSGLLACTTRYQIDEQGRYVQLDGEDFRGVFYYRVKQGDFGPADGHVYGFLTRVPYDLNRHTWLNWNQVFPLSPHLARRVETFQYAAPETPADLIQRADMSIRWQRNRKGQVTGQFSTDALTTLRDTTRFVYLNCP